MGDKQNPARTLVEKVWGTSILDSLPAKWKSAIRLVRTKTPGVKNGTDPDPTDTFDPDNPNVELVATSRVETNRINELEKTTEKIQPTLLLDQVAHGQEYDEQFDVVVPTTEYLTPDNAEVGQPRRRITPLNPQLSEVQTVDPTAVAAVLDNYLLPFPGTVDLSFPPTLVSLTGVVESSVGDSDMDTPYYSAYWDGHGAYSVPITGEARGSAVVMPDVNHKVRENRADKVPTMHYMFFLPSPVGASDVLTKLNALLSPSSVTAWPVFKPESVLILAIGRRLSLGVTADTHIADGGSDDSDEHSEYTNNGASREFSLTIKSIYIPPTIHGSVGIGGTTTDTVTVNVSTDSSIGLLSNSRSESEDITGSITPTSVGATGGATSIPTSGLRLLSVDSAPYKYGYVRVHVETVDFAYFA